MPSPVPKDPRQREIARRLGFLGGAPSTYFTDACALMDRAGELGAVTHLVAHMLREIDGALRDALREMVPEAERPVKESKNRQRRDIAAICDALRITPEDPVRDLWLSFTDGLEKVAHRHGLAAPRPLDHDFEVLWVEAQAVLDAVTRRVEASYAEQLPRIEDLARGGPDLKRFRDGMLHSPVALDRFFALAGVEWLTPLHDARYFDRPSPLEPGEDGGIVFARWPPGPYLVRMAAEGPQIVIEIGRGLETDNPEAQQSLVEAALLMEPADGMALVATIEAWLAATRFQWTLSFVARKLVARLVGAGYVEGALGLARALLTSPGVAGEDGVAAEHLAWLVDEIFPAAGILGLELAVEMLGVQLGGEEGRDRYSSTWRPRIDAERLRGDRDTVVSAVRDAAASLADGGVDLGEILAALERPGLQVSARIALDLLARRPERGLAGARLLDRELLEDSSYRREYRALAVAAFSDLGREDKERLLGWIEEARPWPEAEEAERRRFWQLLMLGGLGALPERWARLRAELEVEVGPIDPDPPELSRGGYIGDFSPLTVEKLAEMEVAAVLDFLATWEPGDGWESPGRAGLARNLVDAVATDPAPFALAAADFEALDPSYARALFGGLQEATEKKRVFDWAGPLGLARAITTKRGDDGQEGASTLEDDPGWPAAWRASVDLLLHGLYSKDLPIHAGLRPLVFEIVAFHLEAPDPYLDGAGEDRDPASVAVGSLRCQALEALISLALFDHRGDPDSRLDADLAALLVGRLDPVCEPAPAVRSVLGARFGDLMIVDEPWARRHLEAIFQVAEPGLWRAAWKGFVERSQAHPLLLGVLGPHYRRAVEEISAGREEGALHDPDEALVAHLMGLYISGSLALAEPDGLLPRFYEVASSGRRAEAIGVLGRSLENFTPVPAKVEERMRELVEWRLAAIGSGGDPQELEGWSWWFSSGEFEVEWSLDFLRRLLAAGGTLGPDHMVAGRLAALADAHPLACVEALQLLIEAGVRPGFVIGSEEEIEAILLAALTADGEAPDRARDLINILVAGGAIGFRRLLPGGGA
jgi:hypothetical protein